MKIRGTWMVAALACMLLLGIRPAAAEGVSYPVWLSYGDGRYHREIVRAGDVYELPKESNTPTMTFIGWSLEEDSGLPVDYLPGSLVEINGERTFYATYYSKLDDADISVSDIPAVKKKKYKEAIFVGDSRIRQAARAIGSSALKKRRIYTVAGAGYSLRDYLRAPRSKTATYIGEKDLLALVKAHNEKKGKPIAVIFCMGINDIKGAYTTSEATAVANYYVSYLKTLKKKLSKYNVKLFFMSMNPVCGDKTGAKEPLSILTFNRVVRAKLPRGYQYINTYSELMKKGFAPKDGNYIDGTHYSAKTYFKIYRYAVKKINAS